MDKMEMRQKGDESDSVTAEEKRGADRKKFLVKLLYTWFSYYPHICGGLLLGSGGPAFLDLLLLTGSNVEQGSIYFTAQYLGILISGMGVGALYDRFHAEPLMLAAITSTAAFNIAIPYCSSSIWLMAIVNGFKGATLGVIFTGCGVICVKVWGKKDGGPYMQALHFAYSVGGVFAPFIMRPFLAPRHDSLAANVTYNGTMELNSSYSLAENGTTNMTFSEWNNTSATNANETRVQYGFLIIGIITFSSALPFAVMILKNDHVTRYSEATEFDVQDDCMQNSSGVKTVPTHKLTIQLRVAFLVFIVLFYILIVAVETLFQNYCMTFVVEHLHWTKTEGTQISSAFWGAFSVGRFQGIFTAKLLSPWKMLVLDFLFLTASVVVLLIGAERSNIVVWICVSVSGIFVASLYATGISYTQQRIMAITGKIYATFMMSATTGAMINPLILGTLIEQYSPMWFIYLAVIICALCVIVFSVMSLMVLKWGKKDDVTEEGGLIQKAKRCYSPKTKSGRVYINSSKTNRER